MLVQHLSTTSRRSAKTLTSIRGYAAKSNESTLYHLAPKGFWKKFRDAVVVNPEISTGLPLPDVHRFPPPASRTEEYSTPATMASDPAQNPYWKRDVRRSYPQLSVVTQEEMAQLLLVASPSQPSGETAVANTSAPQDLSATIANVSASRQLYSPTALPPPAPGVAKWKPVRAPDAPHDPQAYFPMVMYS